ncbi:hypothetical protein [Dentiradicibacter hellwigii]|uniref:Uncharacterized protein n=1 Tax=Dentiradicibacter hellwigii TaxID=3149053 RepID=A0ABV4UEU5_9RHOO
MKKSDLDRFGELLIKEVRDSAFERYLMIKEGKLKSNIAKEMKKNIDLINNKELLDQIVLDVIDSSLFRFLRMLEENDLHIGFLDGPNIVNESDGISGEIFGEDGWVKLYSEFKESIR